MKEKLICYCYEYTEADIKKDLLMNNGRSLFLERIIKARENNTCQCDIKHPEKR